VAALRGGAARRRQQDGGGAHGVWGLPQVVSRLHQAGLALLVAVVRRGRRHGLCFMTVVSSLLLPLLPSPAALRRKAPVHSQARVLAALHCVSECILQVGTSLLAAPAAVRPAPLCTPAPAAVRPAPFPCARLWARVLQQGSCVRPCLATPRGSRLPPPVRCLPARCLPACACAPSRWHGSLKLTRPCGGLGTHQWGVACEQVLCRPVLEVVEAMLSLAAHAARQYPPPRRRHLP